MTISEFISKYAGKINPASRHTVKKDFIWRNKETQAVSFQIPAGSSVNCYFVTGFHSQLAIEFQGKIKFVPIQIAANKLSGFAKAPSENTMWKWMDSGIARTVLGRRTEPDGTGENGEPSWLLVLGLI